MGVKRLLTYKLEFALGAKCWLRREEKNKKIFETVQRSFDVYLMLG
jgi:hypothetical protein